VSVFVAHDPERDEWVCQIPIFPPFQKQSDYSEAQLKQIIMTGLGLGISDGIGSVDSVCRRDIDVTILSVRTWTMDAQV